MEEEAEVSGRLQGPIQTLIYVSLEFPHAHPEPSGPLHVDLGAMPPPKIVPSAAIGHPSSSASVRINAPALAQIVPSDSIPDVVKRPLVALGQRVQIKLFSGENLGDNVEVLMEAWRDMNLPEAGNQVVQVLGKN
jgi:hypothetical protein